MSFMTVTRKFSRPALIISEIFLGEGQNVVRVCCSMGSQQLMFYCIFKKEFLEFWGLCCFFGPNFSSKNLPKIR